MGYGHGEGGRFGEGDLRNNEELGQEVAVLRHDGQGSISNRSGNCHRRIEGLADLAGLTSGLDRLVHEGADSNERSDLGLDLGIGPIGGRDRPILEMD